MLSRHFHQNTRGVTVVELLIALLLSGIVTGAAMEFYVSQHENWLTQEDVSEMQQSLRVSAAELSTKLRNAGAGLPEGLSGIWGGDTNPDTISVRYSAALMTLSVGDHTQNQQAVPIHVDRASDFTGYAVGDRVYIYRPPAGPGEYFIITMLADNPGAGWKEIHHQGQDLVSDPMPGDVIIKMSELRYWIDRTTDSLHPRLIREDNGIPTVYAEEILDLQCTYTLIDSTIVAAPLPGDTVVVVDFSLSAQTVRRNLSVAGQAGKLLRNTGSRILLRNRPGAG